MYFTIHVFSSTWTVDSRATLSTSEVSLGISGDLLDHFGLTANNPTEFHIAALYGRSFCLIAVFSSFAYVFSFINTFAAGERTQVKTWITQKNINTTDAMGRTPLMYAVIGKQTKACLRCCVYSG